MNRSHRGGYVAWLFATAMIVAFMVLYRIRPVAVITFGSSAITLAVLAHVGILTAVAGPLVAWRRRRRR